MTTATFYVRRRNANDNVHGWAQWVVAARRKVTNKNVAMKGNLAAWYRDEWDAHAECDRLNAA